MAAVTMPFPIDLAAFQPLSLDPDQPVLSPDQKATLRANIELSDKHRESEIWYIRKNYLIASTN
jgi:hypothetical protein